jgi:hypothetical protein
MSKLRWLIINLPNIPTMLAFRIVRRAIRRDPGYAEGWQSNIAMAIYDESRRTDERQPYIESAIRRTERGDFDAVLSVPRDEAAQGLRQQIRRPLDSRFCNDAASRFMQICFGVNRKCAH